MIKKINIICRIYIPLFILKMKCVFVKGELVIGKGVRVKRLPLIFISRNASILIGNNVTLNSDNKGYHLNMHSRVKLMADRAGAVIEIGDNSRIHGSCIHALKKVIIGKNCLIAANCQIIDGNGHDISFENPENRINTIGDAREVIIEDNVWIGANAIILPGVRIGKGSIVSASSVVVKDVPPLCLVGGNPAIIIKKHENLL